MKALYDIVGEAIEILQWSRYLALAAASRKPSDAVIITGKVVAVIKTGHGENSPAASMNQPLNLAKGISTSFGSI